MLLGLSITKSKRLDCKREGAKTNYVNKSVYRRTVC